MATLDLLTIEEARSAVSIPADNTDHDSELERFVTGISGRVDELCGPVVTREASEKHDGGSYRIWLHKPPVSSVTSVSEYQQTTENVLSEETNAAKPSDGYLLDNTGLLYYIWRRSGGMDIAFYAGRRNIEVTYQAGRYADTAAVDAKFKLTVQSALRRLWTREQSAWAQGPNFFTEVDDPAAADRFRGFFRAIDPIVRELLADELLPPGVA